jgi:hypothetical protein
MAHEQSAVWRISPDALGRMFEYNLIPFPPTLEKPVWLHLSAFRAGKDETCERGKEMRIDNQQ